MLDLITLILVGAGILQLPLIMDVIQQLFPNSPLGRAVTRVMRYILMGAMIFSVTAALWMNLTLLLKEHANGYQKAIPADYWHLQPHAAIHIIFSLWVYLSLLNHYYVASSHPPSRIRRSTPASSSPAAPPPKPLPPTESLEDAERICSQCQVPKLLRTSHCRICNVCVELMDHRKNDIDMMLSSAMKCVGDNSWLTFCQLASFFLSL